MTGGRRCRPFILLFRVFFLNFEVSFLLNPRLLHWTRAPIPQGLLPLRLQKRLRLLQQPLLAHAHHNRHAFLVTGGAARQQFLVLRQRRRVLRLQSLQDARDNDALQLVALALVRDETRVDVAHGFEEFLELLQEIGRQRGELRGGGGGEEALGGDFGAFALEDECVFDFILVELTALF